MKKEIGILIVDDEDQARNLLSAMIGEMKGFRVAGSASGVDGAIKILAVQAIDVILLDIQMPGKNGFMLVEFLREARITPAIVFVTAFENYALKAIKSMAFDYLLKPVRKEELSETLLRFQDEKVNWELTDYIESLYKTLETKRKLVFSDHKGIFMLSPGKIVYFEAEGNYTYAMVDSGESFCISKNIGAIEESLPRNFIRISRKHIINLQFLTRVNNKNHLCILEGDDPVKLTFSRSRRTALEARLLDV
ncbi:MAG: LytTR family DNA-binding domain-containing protein [Bacteroidales bacterium]|nr:LytTR family DNA-binding domain-containing protein [Bacteroidales bacterium]